MKELNTIEECCPPPHVALGGPVRVEGAGRKINIRYPAPAARAIAVMFLIFT